MKPVSQTKPMNWHHEEDLKRLLLATLLLVLSETVLAEALDETKEEAWDFCVDCIPQLA